MGKINKYVKETNHFKSILREEYLKVFDEIISYIRASELPESDAELLIQDILSNFLEGQKRAGV